MVQLVCSFGKHMWAAANKHAWTAANKRIGNISAYILVVTRCTVPVTQVCMG